MNRVAGWFASPELPDRKDLSFQELGTLQDREAIGCDRKYRGALVTRLFGTAGPALICLVLMWAGVLDYLVDCAATAESAQDARTFSLAPAAGPLYRHITSHAQDGQGTSFCDASEPEHNTALGRAPAQADGFAAAGGALMSPLETWQVREAWAARPVPPHVWLLPPEPPPQGKK